MAKPIDRTSFRVKVAPSSGYGAWGLNCDGTEQVLPFATPDAMCKGKEATDACPCRYRAIIQCTPASEPCTVVVTPNLKLFKDALVRLLTGSTNPWADAVLAPCVSP